MTVPVTQSAMGACATCQILRQIIEILTPEQLRVIRQALNYTASAPVTN